MGGHLVVEYISSIGRAILSERICCRFVSCMYNKSKVLPSVKMTRYLILENRRFNQGFRKPARFEKFDVECSHGFEPSIARKARCKQIIE